MFYKGKEMRLIHMVFLLITILISYGGFIVRDTFYHKGKVEGCRDLMVHIVKDITPVTLHKSLRYCNVTLAEEKK